MVDCLEDMMSGDLKSNAQMTMSELTIAPTLQVSCDNSGI